MKPLITQINTNEDLKEHIHAKTAKRAKSAKKKFSHRLTQIKDTDQKNKLHAKSAAAEQKRDKTQRPQRMME